MTKIGYARRAVSGAALESQCAALRAAGCKVVFSETCSGLLETLPELEKAIASLQAGDELVIAGIERLGRSPALFFERKQRIEERGASLTNLSSGAAADRIAQNAIADALVSQRQTG